VGDRLTKMPACELASRAGLQVPLERYRRRFLIEFDHDHTPPRSRFGRMRGQTRVVRFESSLHVRCHADVIGTSCVDALENVDKSLRFSHDTRTARPLPSVGAETPSSFCIRLRTTVAIRAR